MREIRYYDLLPSTQSVAASAAREGAPHLYTVVAREQNGGRGRLQRAFFSPRGGLYFSTVLRVSLLPCEYGVLTPIAAVAVARAISRVCGVTPKIKWVNDLLFEEKKVCGILAESGNDQDGKPYVILGIGINTANTPFPDELRDTAGVIPCPDNEALLDLVLDELTGVETMAKTGEWLDFYRQNSAVLGRRVRVIEGESSYLATALDVLSDGALSVQLENGEKRELRGGEISLRLTP